MKVLLLISLFVSINAHAWGKRGHETVGSLAAQLLAKEQPGGRFLINHTYDMGYYNNVPDLVWKAVPEIYKKEFTQHYLDREIYDRTFVKREQTTAPWNPSRLEFFKNYPELNERAGRAPWRIQEFSQRLEKVTQELKNKKLTRKERHQLQEKWLLAAGIMGHYVADLAQPMHVSENHDGQLSNQKGLHHWFEENIIDDLYPSITDEVYKKAQSRWKEFYEKHKTMSAFEMSLELVKDSSSNMKRVLDLDKKVGRASEKKVSGDYRELAIERLSTGVLYLAAIWAKNLDWQYDGEKFYNFVVKPDYIEPGT